METNSCNFIDWILNILRGKKENFQAGAIRCECRPVQARENNIWYDVFIEKTNSHGTTIIYIIEDYLADYVRYNTHNGESYDEEKLAQIEKMINGFLNIPGKFEFTLSDSKLQIVPIKK